MIARMSLLLRKQSSSRAGSKRLYNTAEGEREEREVERVDQQDKSVTFEDGQLHLMVDPEEISIVAQAQWVKDEAEDVAFAFL